VITGGAGLLGVQHGEIIAAAGGIPILLDLDEEKARANAEKLAKEYQVDAWGLAADIRKPPEVDAALQKILQRHERLDILINNAAIDAKVGQGSSTGFARVENFPLEKWDIEMDVGLKGTFICSQIFGGEMARRGRGVIVNIGSEYGVNGPDQRLYRQEGLAEEDQPVKPITYTVVKSGLIGMTRYFALYWGPKGVRVNAASLAGVHAGQSDEFVRRYVRQVPLGRMAEPSEYQGTILYLCADASRFLTGVNLVIDGGKSCW
jgi:NAD(P)-dependent dehydrogenase (short-subunit alcohol dehydrogenase family)